MKTSSRMLIVGLNYAPEPVGIRPYSTGLAEELVARGHSVEVITAKPYYPQWRIHPEHAAGWWRTTVENGVRITRCPLYVTADPGGMARIVHLASFALAALLPALRAAFRPRGERPEVVFAVAPALLCVLTAWLAARIAGAALWVHVQDFEVEAAIATGLLPPRSLAARVGRRLEGHVLRLADRASTISPRMCAKLIEKGIPAERVLEVRNWADVRFAPDPDGAAALRVQWGIGERTVALYSGNIARKQGIEILIAAARLLAWRADIVFVICGEGPNRAALEAAAAGMANVQLHGLQPATRMGAMLTMADLHLLPQIAGAADLVLPSKLTNMLLSGRPVVATTEPDTGLSIEVDGCGTITPPGDPAALAAAIAALADDRPHRAGLGDLARRRADERWLKHTIVDRLEAALLVI